MTAGKYKATAVRAELAVALTGHILHLHAPAPGCRNDAPMRDEAEEETPWHPEESGLGDKAYKGSNKIITAFVKPSKNRRTGENPQLTPQQKAFNLKYNGVRQRVRLLLPLIRHDYPSNTLRFAG